MKLSSSNLILLLLAVPASGLDMSSSAEKFRDILSQINNNSNVKDYALGFTATVRGAKQIEEKDISALGNFAACGEDMDVPDFKGMDDNMENYFENGICTANMADDLVILTCDLSKSNNEDYTEYAKLCEKQNGQVVDISNEMCMTSEMMESGLMRRKLQESGNSMKIVANDFPLCLPKVCNDESKAVMEGVYQRAIDMLGMSCGKKENPRAKFFLKKKKNNKVKKMPCGKLAKKKPEFIKNVCFSAKYQDYSGGRKALPASQVCGETCKPDPMNTVEEVPSAIFSVMKDNKEETMTCGDLKNMESEMDTMWTCLVSLKVAAPAPSKKKGGKKKGGKKKGGKKGGNKIYGGAHKVCTETCGEVWEMMEEEESDNY